MKKLLLATAVLAVAISSSAFAHDVKDNPLRDRSDTTIGTMTPYPGSPVVNTDKDGQVTANFTTVLPGPIGGRAPLGLAPNADLATKQ